MNYHPPSDTCLARAASQPYRCPHTTLHLVMSKPHIHLGGHSESENTQESVSHEHGGPRPWGHPPSIFPRRLHHSLIRIYLAHGVCRSSTCPRTCFHPYSLWTLFHASEDCRGVFDQCNPPPYSVLFHSYEQKFCTNPFRELRQQREKEQQG